MKSPFFSLIEEEKKRQEAMIDLIASENYADEDILSVSGSVMTNKYAEGYPGRRYYGGCQVVDKAEFLAIEMGKQLFGCDHINVQPHSGSSANFAVYFACLKPGDTVLGMNLAAGGHLTHGHKINFSGTLYNVIPYGVDPRTELIDYDELETLAAEHKPKMIIAGGSAYSRLIDFKRFRHIADSCGALLMVDMAHFAGLVAGKVVESPVPYADIVTSTTHKTLRGPRGGIIMCKKELAQKIDRAVMPGTQGGPLMHVVAAKGLAFEKALAPLFQKYCQQVIKNAQAMAKEFQALGYRIITGGTDTHLFLVDLTNKGITGKEAEIVLESCNIVLNRNGIPFDTQSPLITSGIRIGSPAITTRGFTEKEAIQVAILIDEVIRNKDNKDRLEAIKKEVDRLCRQFPVYGKEASPLKSAVETDLL